MITAEEIKSSLEACTDFPVMTDLIGKLEHLRASRIPFFLTREEFEKILKWKLRGQYDRIRDRLVVNSEEVTHTITEASFKIMTANIDENYKLELCIKILSALRAVDIGVASAVLGLVSPNEYCAIDFRVWRQVFPYKRKTWFSIADYEKYLCAARNYSKTLKRSVQEIDLGIWHFDRTSCRLPC